MWKTQKTFQDVIAMYCRMHSMTGCWEGYMVVYLIVHGEKVDCIRDGLVVSKLDWGISDKNV